MIKPESLRNHLTACLPLLQQNPEQLLMFVENGKVVSSKAGEGRSLSFEYRYNLVLIFTDWSQHTNHIVVPMLQWLNQYQPDYLDNPEARERGIEFAAELMNHSTADIEFKLALTEAVAVNDLPGGQIEAVHLPEPKITVPGESWEAFLNGEPYPGVPENG